MRLKSPPFLLFAVLAFPAISRADVTVIAIVTPQEAQAEFDAGRYPECLRKIAAALLSPDRPTPAVRAALLNLKAECMFQQKDVIPATDAFVAAADAYGDDKKGAALATATAALIRKSTNLLYTPKTGTDKTPLPILPLATRSAALNALFKDELAADEPIYKSLKGKNTLAPIVDFAAKLRDFNALELATAGASTQTADMLTTLSAQAKTSMDAGLAQWTKSADAIATTAATMVNAPAQNTGGAAGGTAGGGGGRGGRTGRGGAGGGRGGQGTQQPQQQQERGLTASDKTSLNNILGAVEKVPPAIKTLTSSLATDADYFKTENTDAIALKNKVDGILAGRYK